MMRLVGPSGPSTARIMIVGEAPGEEEERSGLPFVGQSGQELTRMLSDAGIRRDECWLTNVCKSRPRDNDIEHFITSRRRIAVERSLVPFNGQYVHPLVPQWIELLKKEIESVRPNVILALGNTPLHTLCNLDGITTWRGSVLPSSLSFTPPRTQKVVAALHPAYVLRMWSARHITVQDFRRAAREATHAELRTPSYEFIIRPSFEEAITRISRLQSLVNAGPTQLAVDIETRARQIACVGIAHSASEAICIPFMCIERDGNYWPSPSEEASIVRALRDLLTHPNARCIGQFFLYDAQYFARCWGFVPRVDMSIEIAHHTAFCELPLALDFQSSLYASFYQYWKDEGKEWDTSKPEEQWWTYNCKDAVYTWENAQTLKDIIRQQGLTEQYLFEQSLFMPVLRMMLRGVSLSQSARADLDRSISQALDERERKIAKIAGYDLNPRSPKQMADFFYHQMGAKPNRNKSGGLTCDDDALSKIERDKPILRPLIAAIKESRTLNVGLANVVRREPDEDGRMRCSYKIAGPVTFRFASSESAFNTGTNLQNITAGGTGESGLQLPNLRRIIVPSEGHCFVEADLERADLQVVVAECEDTDLRQRLDSGADIHMENAKDLFGPSATKTQRHLAKTWVHGTNYGGYPKTMAAHCGITIAQAESMRKRWFQAHPRIKDWHDRIESQLASTRTISNRFGFKRFFFGRVQELLKEALGWIPQSTVAIVINKGLLAADHHGFDLRLQVHDSLLFEVPTNELAYNVLRIKQLLAVSIPYSPQLTIPVSIKVSDKSWGDMEPYDE